MTRNWTPPETFSTTEQNTGRVWIDGKTVFQKVVNVGALPDTTEKIVAHGITGLDVVISVQCLCHDPTGPDWFLMPQPRFGPGMNTTTSIDLQLDATNLEVRTGSDRTNFTECFVTILYTKS